MDSGDSGPLGQAVPKHATRVQSGDHDNATHQDQRAQGGSAGGHHRRHSHA